MKVPHSKTVEIERWGLAAAFMLASLLAMPSSGSAHGGVQHPVTINSGTCAALGDVAIPLGDAGDQLPIDGVASAGEHQGAESATQVDGSLTKVQLPFADLLAGPYAIVVHASADEIDSAVACGDIGGMMIGTLEFPVGIAQVETSGTSGVAILRDNGDGTTQVAVYVIRDEATGHDHEGHDVATPGN